ncbi:MAG: VWA domain-containing protein [Kiritimatiellaeota bacterium]|nr:VWA domain-containing protein [Kiritimatiellota bacterium]
MNPLVSMAYAVLITAVLTVAAAAAAWRSSHSLGRTLRLIVTGARTSAVLLLCVLLFNPGNWRRRRNSQDRPWLILLDRSASMAVRDEGGAARWDAALRLARRLDRANDAGPIFRFSTFTDRLENAMSLDAAEKRLPDGRTSDIARSLEDAVTPGTVAGTGPAGVLLVSDGRQVGPGDPERAVALAVAAGIPVYAVTVGGRVPIKDLALENVRRRYVVFKNRKWRLRVRVRATGLGPVEPELRVLDPGGRVAAERRVRLADGAEAAVTFVLDAGDRSGCFVWRIETAPWPGESNPANNHLDTSVAVLDRPAKVLLLEGVPGWDSKFTARALRNRPTIELTEMYRVGPGRFYRISPGGERNDLPRRAAVSLSAAEFAKFDVVLIGKGLDAFFGAAGSDALVSWVDRQGGMVVFFRGPPCSRADDAVDALLPVAWDTGNIGGAHLSPTPEAAAELFDDVLAEAKIAHVSRLPVLPPVRRCRAAPGFSRVLAAARTPHDPGDDRAAVPVLAVRRAGRGLSVVLTVNGFWRWDFFAREPEASAFFRAFWPGLIHWVLTHSEFLPGAPWALDAEPTAVRLGTPIQVRVRARYGVRAAPPTIRVILADKRIASLAPARNTAPDAEGEWQAVYVPPRPGLLRFRLPESADEGAGRAVERTVRVMPPPAESDDLSADPAFLERLAARTDGKVVAPSECRPDAVFFHAPPALAEDDAEAVWGPSWDSAFFLATILVLFGGEIFLRRRNGLL